MSTTPQHKIDTVKELVQLIQKYPIVGAVNMENMPTPQLQNMRSQLRESVVLKMTKKRLILIALEEAKGKKGIEELKKHVKGMPALLFTNENPFKLFKVLKKNKSTAPAKAGQTAPSDVEVKAGPTGFAPGPIIGELGALGIKAGINAGKVAIKEDSIVLKEGEIFTAQIAAILTRLKIEPMEIGLDLVATYENGTIFTKKVLNIDEDEFLQNINTAASWAFNLAMESGFPTKDTIELMIMKAFTQAKGLSIESNILTDLTAVDILSKVERQASGLQNQLDIKPVKKAEEAPKQEKKEKSEDKQANTQDTEEKAEGGQ